MKRIEDFLTVSEITELAKERFREERNIDYLSGWFLAKEIQRKYEEEYKELPDSIRIAKVQVKVAEEIPLWISDYSIFAGTQDDAFARSYALINPSFKVESFKGYCDPVAVFDDIEPKGEITRERIDGLREYHKNTPFVKDLNKAVDKGGDFISEAVFFFEQVSGHIVPDLRPLLKWGVRGLQEQIQINKEREKTESKKRYFEAMGIALEASLVYAKRYGQIAKEKAEYAKNDKDKQRFELMAATLERVPENGAENLYEAIQAFIIIWQTMCMEQVPNPYAFSVGNADRIFEPYRKKGNQSREIAAACFKHFLVFFNVADRSWAISQNLMVGGKAVDGEDLTNPSTYALLDAYYDMNLPQPALSIKLHRKTPDELYEEMGKFFFTSGCLTPSLFNDDSLFPILENMSGIDYKDLPDYSAAGCQEPLIMGKDNGNTTNSWLNLAKILELTINNGSSLLTGKRLGLSDKKLGYNNKLDVLRDIRKLFYENTELYVKKMVRCANAVSRALSILQVPFLSSMMGGADTGVDMRDTKKQGSKYNGSGCLIHGLSVIANSFIAIDSIVEKRPEDAKRLIEALKNNFENDSELYQYLITAPKFGNNLARVDKEAAEIASKVSDIVSSHKNYLGNPFRPDWSTPSTHLLYGHWVGATPDGRKAGEALNYGVDPLFGDASSGLEMRILSNMRLPFEKFNGGYASHLGIDPGYFQSETYEEKGMEFKDKVVVPLFYNPYNANISPFYFYVNVTTPETLRKILENPAKYVPSGIYIMRIHGTFVNFLELSSDIQEDIIARLDPESTAM